MADTRLCFVVQRYGLEVAGGAEQHCRWLAGRLARSYAVQVVTTCALDYVEWRNHYPPGRDVVDGVPVTRYPVRRPRSERRFALASDLVFHDEHSLADERAWVEENGPYSPELVRALPDMRHVDLFVFYCYRYYQTFFGLPLVAERSLLVPTAEEDPAIELPVFRGLFQSARGFLYLTPEERSLVEGASGNASRPHAVIGTGLQAPSGWEGIDLAARFSLSEPYLLYVGRIDRNKGVDRLVEYYSRLAADAPDLPPLVLVGKPVLDLPKHPRTRALGFVSEAEKHALMARCDVFLMPSPYESLSIVALEAWALGRPVLANAACRVLEGQCLRSGGGLFYRGYAEFAEALQLLVARPDLRDALGRAGQAYVRREYDWEIAESRTRALIDSLVGG